MSMLSSFWFIKFWLSLLFYWLVTISAHWLFYLFFIFEFVFSDWNLWWGEAMLKMIGNWRRLDLLTRFRFQLMNLGQWFWLDVPAMGRVRLVIVFLGKRFLSRGLAPPVSLPLVKWRLLSWVMDRLSMLLTLQVNTRQLRLWRVTNRNRSFCFLNISIITAVCCFWHPCLCYCFVGWNVRVDMMISRVWTLEIKQR